MSLTRRKFIVLSSFTSLGLIGVFTKLFLSQTAQSSDIASNTNRINLQPIEPPTTPLLLRFVSVADTGTGAKGQYAVADAMTRYREQNPYNLVILAGDNIYTNGEIEKIEAVFEKPYAALLQQGVKFHACLGNHDIRTDNGDPQVKYPGFNMLGRYYTFREGDVQFFALDTNSNADWKNQLPWLETQLSSSDAPWKIVFGHHQIYSSGHYGLNQAFIKTLSPIFQKYGVQLYINGHEHHYERSKSINGTTYLICGAGAGTRPVGSSESSAYAAERLSFAAYEVYRDRIIISGIGTDGELFDRGVILIRG
ncbi:MAG TPA: metallophosphoesterase [Cyanobacteria bacterium UBA11149]|nr:metallophosphoesterase [Cyanobacteria bacterium UBA11367]HBE58023.1 metallophosphoesterase [Cyanobacteria bacterium UBA11366]HBK66272.1 metallophosphoesterase [Cyanobacteria bacterium UBA11166]HBR72414.1 metallophosphoesterase [Cyanobacteria bacterium UBA11159]HBS71738.1 metallophosphoesterase [Cyanobacteria bacterium UBA11153]HBW90553.1 metallophosphoesterase [Cyanobacteria bacterium UBA11149]HCA93942.1 metallophosphoesterase [Cyanobacteria bacterium UBA9226]